MFDTLKKVIQNPRITNEYPKKPLVKDNFRGKTVIDAEKCTFCGECAERCPSGAVVMDKAAKTIGIDMDQCLFCCLCEDICPVGACTNSHEIELAVKSREELRVSPIILEERDIPDEEYEVLCSRLQEKIRQKLGRSLQIREVDSGSCNACDYEINALNNPLNDLERLGIHFVASPRHADMLLVTGTATRNMELALVKTYNATPDPKLIVAVGACACSGGIFRDNYAVRNGIDCIVPVDVYIPGCPPRPPALIYGILKALDRI
ncbi:MAG: NADH-quinone oxidoreductase subunit NuoB [Bacillota bacterium]|jgi:Ni,Fe-hydrogenase III small subunit/ferredoxin